MRRDGGGGGARRRFRERAWHHDHPTAIRVGETARQEAKAQFGRIARGENPTEERQLDQKAITVKEPCALSLKDLNAGLIMGKGGRPKKLRTHHCEIIETDNESWRFKNRA